MATPLGPRKKSPEPIRSTGAAGKSLHAVAQSGSVPVTIRVPRAGERDPITGLGRYPILALITPSEANGFKPPVKSLVVRGPGKKRGTRLVSMASLLDYIDRMMDDPAAIGFRAKAS